MANKAIRDSKRHTAINIPVNEEEYEIFNKVIREYHHETAANFIRKMILKEYRKLVDEGWLERV